MSNTKDDEIKVYIPTNDGNIWIPGTVLEIKEKIVRLQTEASSIIMMNLETKTLSTNNKTLSLDQLDALKHMPKDPTEKVTEIITNYLPLRCDKVEEVADLRNLQYLNEPGILYTLRQRFYQDMPYTYIGNVVIAINPYTVLPLYTHEMQEEYTVSNELFHHIQENRICKLKKESLSNVNPPIEKFLATLKPHVYGTALKAFYLLVSSNIPQSILISGESGAGKTETCKIVMQHLATLSVAYTNTMKGGIGLYGGHRESIPMADTKTNVIERIIESNPLLETFGNAKTVRNDNSSRFGKFILLLFRKNIGEIVGARAITYLLEKSRIIQQEEGERNFHIFYQLCHAAKHIHSIGLEVCELQDSAIDNATTTFCTIMRSVMKLNLHTIKHFSFLRDDPTLSVTDMYAQLKRTIKALTLLGITPATQSELFHILAGILLLGQIEFDQSDVDSCSIRDTNISNLASTALELEGLENYFCTRTVVVRSESFIKTLTVEQAYDRRNALSKSLYARLFDWLVSKINISLKCTLRSTSSTSVFSSRASVSSALSGLQTRAKSSSPGNVSTTYVGLLDIFGFEDLTLNSFEQLCINYANETLQRRFIRDYLEVVQEEYKKEAIQWTHFEYPNNSNVLEAIEGKLGILSLLNEECILPTGSNKSFASKLRALYEDSSIVSISKTRPNTFSIEHYAAKVTYNTDVFLEKNKDPLSEEGRTLLSLSQMELIAGFFNNEKTEKKSATTRCAALNTVSTQFKTSLGSLMKKIDETNVFYIRCIKPNLKKIPKDLNHQSIIQQLRCSGIIETIKVMKAAYTAKLPQWKFIRKYKITLTQRNLDLLNAEAKARGGVDLKRLCEKDLDTAVTTAESPQEFSSVVSEDFESIELQISQGAMLLEERKLTCERMMALLLPERQPLVHFQIGLTCIYFSDGVLEDLELHRRNVLYHSVALLQATVRAHLAYKKYVILKRGVRKLQSIIRRRRFRKVYISLRNAICFIQAHFRGKKQRRIYTELRKKRRSRLFHAMIKFIIIYHLFRRRNHALIKIQSYWKMHVYRKKYSVLLSKTKKSKALNSKVVSLQTKLGGKLQKSLNETHKPRKPSILTDSVVETLEVSCGDTIDTFNSSGDLKTPNATLMSTGRDSTTSFASKGLYHESAEVLQALYEENEQLHKELEELRSSSQKLREENNELKEWKRKKEHEDKVKDLSHRKQEAKDYEYLNTVEKEYNRLAAFVAEYFGISRNSSAGTEEPLNRDENDQWFRRTVNNYSIIGEAIEEITVDPNEQNHHYSRPSSPSVVKNRWDNLEIPSPAMKNTGKVADRERQNVLTMLNRSFIRIERSRIKGLKGNARHVKDYWEEVQTFPPGLNYGLGSTPWRRLLSDWAQGNPKKLEYMTKWLRNVLETPDLENSPYPMGVELKSVTPMMLDGFLQLVIPKIAERRDINVYVHTKEFIGTSMRITLAVKEELRRARTESVANIDKEKKGDELIDEPKEEIDIEKVVHVRPSMQISTDRSPQVEKQPSIGETENGPGPIVVRPVMNGINSNILDSRKRPSTQRARSLGIAEAIPKEKEGKKRFSLFSRKVKGN